MHYSIDRTDDSFKVTLHASRSSRSYGCARAALNVAVVTGIVALAWAQQLSTTAACLAAAGLARGLWQRSEVVAESLLVDRRTGSLQLAKIYASGHAEAAPKIGLGRAQVVLNEGITRQRVLLYMAIIVKGEVNLGPPIAISSFFLKIKSLE